MELGVRKGAFQSSIGPSGHSIQIGSQRPRSARVLELAQGLSLNLPDALATDPERVPDFFQRMFAGRAQAETQTNDALLARTQECERLADRIPQT
jgi:hypothetical protein